jgi:TolB protein
MNRRAAIFGTLGAILDASYCPGFASIGVFTTGEDIGETGIPGSAQFDGATGEYRVCGAGANVSGSEDAFYFVWRRISGNATLAADVRFVSGISSDRKALLMIRWGTDTHAAYIAAVLHSSGRTTMQCREHGITWDHLSKIPSATRLRLERQGDVVTAYAGTPIQERNGIASTVTMKGPAYIGLGVCSHSKSILEAAVFSNLQLFDDPGQPDGGRP